MKPPRTDACVRLNTAVPNGVPLSKERIAIYNSGLVPIERYERDRGLITRVQAESLRIDLGWGAEWMPRKREVVNQNSNGSLEFDFEETDQIARLLDEVGTRPYWSYCYVPSAARRPEQTWKGMAEDDSIWVETVRNYVGSMSERGVSIGYHEVYNEPDLRDERTGEPHFYEGDLEDYLALYRSTSRAIREVDPSAKVGGPALAVTSVNAHWLEKFLDMVQREGLPLDFISFHHYGHFSLENTIGTVRRVLAGFEGFDNLELHLNEYNSFIIDYPRGGLQDSHYLASSFASEIPRLLRHRDITRTHWAQFMDSGDGNYSGMIDIDGIPKPVYDVYEFYQGMPLNQVEVVVEGPKGVGAIASSDDVTTRAMVWNRSATVADVVLEVDNTQLAGTLTVLDGLGRSTTELPAARPQAITLMAGAVVLVHLGKPVAANRPRRCVATVPRPAQGDDGWCDVDERTGHVLLQAGSTPISRQVTLDTTDPLLTQAEWAVVVDDGEPTFSVSLQSETDAGVATVALCGSAVHEVPPHHRPRRKGDTRLTLLFAGVPPQTRVSVLPREVS